jgi:hypothetical protein
VKSNDQPRFPKHNMKINLPGDAAGQTLEYELGLIVRSRVDSLPQPGISDVNVPHRVWKILLWEYWYRERPRRIRGLESRRLPVLLDDRPGWLR